MTYPEIVEWLVRDILASTDSKDDLEANVDRYMEDLAASVLAKANETFTPE